MHVHSLDLKLIRGLRSVIEVDRYQVLVDAELASTEATESKKMRRPQHIRKHDRVIFTIHTFVHEIGDTPLEGIDSVFSGLR